MAEPPETSAADQPDATNRPTKLTKLIDKLRLANKKTLFPRIIRRLLREEDDDVIPREMVLLAVIISVTSIVLGVLGDAKSGHVVLRLAADSFLSNILASLALIGPGFVITDIFVARWRRQRERRAIAEALQDIALLAADLIDWSETANVAARRQVRPPSLRPTTLQRLLSDISTTEAKLTREASKADVGSKSSSSYYFADARLKESLIRFDSATGANIYAFIATSTKDLEIGQAQLDSRSKTLAIALKAARDLNVAIKAVEIYLPSHARSLFSSHDFEPYINEERRRRQELWEKVEMVTKVAATVISIVFGGGLGGLGGLGLPSSGDSDTDPTNGNSTEGQSD